MNLFSMIQHCKIGSGAFLCKEELPNGLSLSGNLPDLDLEWATTYEFKGRAKDHCGTICAVNLALWLLRQYKPHKEMLFRLFYHYIKKGPTLSTRGLKKAFKTIGFPLQRQRIKSYEQLKIAINQGKPVCILLSTQGFHWHWVMAVGWREFPNGERYLRIVDNWRPTSERYYKPPKDAEWLYSETFILK